MRKRILTLKLTYVEFGVAETSYLRRRRHALERGEVV
jgi:hypothetical protein